MKFLFPLLVLSVWTFSTSEACHCNMDEDAPICGSDGKTYKNSCIFVCEKRPAVYPTPPATVLYKGSCDSDRPCGCSMYFEPVCGSDGQTWPNPCLLNCSKKNSEADDEIRKGLKVENTGQCGLPCDCTGNDTEELMCGSDNATYKNQCVIDCVINAPYGKFLKMTVKHNGAC